MPESKTRKEIILDCHKKLLHRGTNTIYYALKEKWYWYGMKKDIDDVLSKCEECSINNRKRSEGNTFVTTTKQFEKVAIDILDLNLEKEKILIMIDYFSRYIIMDIIEDRTSKTIIKSLTQMFKKMDKPNILVTDNAKEFVSQEFKLWCTDNNINQYCVSPESHKSNGRIERVIRTVREGLIKCKLNDIKEKIKYVAIRYNESFHAGIKCSPIEALEDISGIANLENSKEGKYSKQFKSYKKEKFNKGQQVRLTKKRKHWEIC